MSSDARRFVSSFSEQESIDQVFRANDKQLRSNRNGNLFLQVELSDRSGSIAARMWNAKQRDYDSFDNGDYVRVEGTTQLFQGAMQMIANSVRKAEGTEVDESDFQALTSPQIDAMANRLAAILRAMNNPHLRNLADAFLLDDRFMGKFTQAPAGIKNHHAYHGGLLEHVVNLMEIVLLVAPRYPQLDAELLLVGAFLHDAGKVDELGYEKGLTYTDQGQLLGHIVLAISLLDAKIREAEQLAGEPLPEELVLRLKHVIVSHHGQYEFGSPRLPMTLEAIALHQLDNLDAKIHNFHLLMQDDANTDSHWTQFHHNLGRKLYKGP
ncbi:MAG: HD domain-containing protein [Planctomycetales bacterium]|nr:HD domain-containing protein [Planctomycetales bacterium]